MNCMQIVNSRYVPTLRACETSRIVSEAFLRHLADWLLGLARADLALACTTLAQNAGTQSKPIVAALVRGAQRTPPLALNGLVDAAKGAVPSNWKITTVPWTPVAGT